MAKLKRGVLSPSQMKAMMALGLLSTKGKSYARKALMGVYNKSRYRR